MTETEIADASERAIHAFLIDLHDLKIDISVKDSKIVLRARNESQGITDSIRDRARALKSSLLDFLIARAPKCEIYGNHSLYVSESLQFLSVSNELNPSAVIEIEAQGVGQPFARLTPSVFAWLHQEFDPWERFRAWALANLPTNDAETIYRDWQRVGQSLIRARDYLLNFHYLHEITISLNRPQKDPFIGYERFPRVIYSKEFHLKELINESLNLRKLEEYNKMVCEKYWASVGTSLANHGNSSAEGPGSGGKSGSKSGSKNGSKSRAKNSIGAQGTGSSSGGGQTGGSGIESGEESGELFGAWESENNPQERLID